MINIFVTILSDGLSKIRHGSNEDECEEQKQNEPDLIGYLKWAILNFLKQQQEWLKKNHCHLMDYKLN